MDQRRQIDLHIRELQANCSRLALIRDGLSSKLDDLNRTVDQLLTERDYNRITDINQNETPLPSEKFKIRLTTSLRDIEPKAQEILNIGEALAERRMSTNTTLRMIDIGANLTDPVFRGIYNSNRKHADDFNHMLDRAKAAGVEGMIITGGSLGDSKAALALAELSESLYSTVGVHPTRCQEFEHRPEVYLRDLEILIESGNGKIVAIGELGLDYERLHFCPKEIQKTYFELQLSLAEKFNLPLFLHNRNSIDDLIEILERNKSKFSSAGGVVHSFDGTTQDLNRVLDLGLFIGINGCSLKTEDNLETVKRIPTDRLLIETDCPWCEIRQSSAAFKYVRSKFAKSKDASNPDLAVKNRNEPSTLRQVLEVLSELREQDMSELSDAIYTNTIRLFFSKR